ncbi:hypothetical protein NQ317_011211 [Molorchus minor]|uniref:Reverse transcriptase n=1 Tax=Molorchus minor TaxID=1323400 RepID=A0ABQ9JG60_9CUCU|nr:hypothetical protein NQ317_011211 [Molorchus minor]
MLNTEGPKQSRSKALTEVVHSTLVYAAPVWAKAMRIKKTKPGCHGFRKRWPSEQPAHTAPYPRRQAQ